MTPEKRAARAKRRANSNRLVRQGVPFTHSKWHYLSAWRAPMNLLGHVMPIGRWQSYRKKASRLFGGGVRDNRRA
jgi:hypothetical protein